MARENAVIADDDDRQKGMNEAAGPHEQIQGRWKGELREHGQRLHGTLVSQNHLFGVSTMKPGRLRLFTLRLAFSVILAFAQNVFRPGFLGSIGTIHFARWVMLPGGQLLFYSNYGGSWESYLEDFITKAHAGLTGVWSNTIGFPRTRVLFLDGATDGDRFKRWARRQQHPTLAWYCAYPHLSTSRIRANAAIRQGLGATTESEARDWLGCFGSAPPTASKLEAGDIQAVLYSGLGRLKYSRALILRLGCQLGAEPGMAPPTGGRHHHGGESSREECFDFCRVAFRPRQAGRLRKSESQLSCPVSAWHARRLARTPTRRHRGGRTGQLVLGRNRRQGRRRAASAVRRK